MSPTAAEGNDILIDDQDPSEGLDNASSCSRASANNSNSSSPMIHPDSCSTSENSGK